MCYLAHTRPAFLGEGGLGNKLHGSGFKGGLGSFMDQHGTVSGKVH